MLRILDRLEEILISALMGAATLLIFVSVLHRFGTGISFLYPYLIQIHIAWTQELCIYMFIWMAKFGAAYGVRTGIHVGVDVLINRLNDRWRKGVILFGLAGGALFTAIVGTMGAKFVFVLMLTGMPISISLGLTVLTFLFTMTEVPIESVGLKLFSGLDNFGIMAIPFFILAGTFLTRGGVARRMIAFTTSLVGHLPGGL